MAQPNRKPGEIVEAVVEKKEGLSALRSQAVAIDPPPTGAIGIRELLDRFERFTAADDLTDPPGNGPVGVRELLARLGSLAEAGVFARPEPDESDQT